MTRIIYYKIVHDDGVAPCVADNLLSLSVGKPVVRRSAAVGDWLLGFAASSLATDNRLIYVACIDERLMQGDYFRHAEYERRKDCIYRWDGHAFVLRAGATHHHDTARFLEHDLGKAPEYAGAVTLLARKYRYYGMGGTDDYKHRFPALGAVVTKLGQGHRSNHTPDVLHELQGLIQSSLDSAT